MSRKPGAKRSICASTRGSMSAVDAFGTWQYAHATWWPAARAHASNRDGRLTEEDEGPLASPPRQASRSDVPISSNVPPRCTVAARAQRAIHPRDRRVERPIHLVRRRSVSVPFERAPVRAEAPRAGKARNGRGERSQRIASAGGKSARDRTGESRDDTAAERAQARAPAHRDVARPTACEWPSGEWAAAAARDRPRRVGAVERPHRVRAMPATSARACASANRRLTSRLADWRANAPNRHRQGMARPAWRPSRFALESSANPDQWRHEPVLVAPARRSQTAAVVATESFHHGRARRRRDARAATGGSIQVTPCASSCNPQRTVDARAIGWTAEQTSCRKPGASARA